VSEGPGQQQRYCTNCGHELREEDRFCRSCGRPVHQVARLPTPDADVPVPPPTQLRGAGAPPGLSLQERDRTDRRRLLLLGSLAIIGLLIVVGIASAITGGGSGGDVAEKPKHEPREAASSTSEVTTGPSYGHTVASPTGETTESVDLSNDTSEASSNGESRSSSAKEHHYTVQESQYTAPSKSNDSGHVEVGDRVTVVGKPRNFVEKAVIDNQYATTLEFKVNGTYGTVIMLFAWSDQVYTTKPGAEALEHLAEGPYDWSIVARVSGTYVGQVQFPDGSSYLAVKVTSPDDVEVLRTRGDFSNY
jgi:hypothetical protein